MWQSFQYHHAFLRLFQSTSSTEALYFIDQMSLQALLSTRNFVLLCNTGNAINVEDLEPSGYQAVGVEKRATIAVVVGLLHRELMECP